MRGQNRTRKWYPIGNRDASQAPDYKRIGSPLDRCFEKPKHVFETITTKLKGHPGLDRGKGPID